MLAAMLKWFQVHLELCLLNWLCANKDKMQINNLFTQRWLICSASLFTYMILCSALHVKSKVTFTKRFLTGISCWKQVIQEQYLQTFTLVSCSAKARTMWMHCNEPLLNKDKLNIIQQRPEAWNTIINQKASTLPYTCVIHYKHIHRYVLLGDVACCTYFKVAFLFRGHNNLLRSLYGMALQMDGLWHLSSRASHHISTTGGVIGNMASYGFMLIIRLLLPRETRRYSVIEAQTTSPGPYSTGAMTF